MIENIFYMLVGGSILFMILCIIWDSTVFGLLDVFLWFICAAAVHSIEIPYTAIASDDTIVTGVHELQSAYPISLLFVAIGVIMFIYIMTDKILPTLTQKFSRMM